MDQIVPKIGRNDPCWCHSGKKYKKCHLKRDRQPKRQPWEVAAEMRQQFENNEYCTHALAGPSSCEGQIVRAHTIPRSAGLTAIAERGHVYGPDYDLMSLVKNGGKLLFRLTGINEASTFTGFCGFHDYTTFQPLENQRLTATAQQCFLMGYRAACRELFQKASAFRISQDYARTRSRSFDSTAGNRSDDSRRYGARNSSGLHRH